MQELRLSNKAGELPFVREMFDRIAPRYDFLNRLLSLRQDVMWRRMMVAVLGLSSRGVVMDAACGTADVMIEILAHTGQKIHLVGIDFSSQMLQLAYPKLKSAGWESRSALAAADVFDLPFGPDTFEAVTMAFGIRNIQNKAEVLAQFYRHLKPGGRLAILELATPARGILRRFYLSYFVRLLPLIGRFFSRHRYAYTYLPDSVAQFPASADFAQTMRRSGFVHVRYRPLTLGICVLFVGDKPLD